MVGITNIKYIADCFEFSIKSFVANICYYCTKVTLWYAENLKKSFWQCCILQIVVILAYGWFVVTSIRLACCQQKIYQMHCNITRNFICAVIYGIKLKYGDRDIVYFEQLSVGCWVTHCKHGQWAIGLLFSFRPHSLFCMCFSGLYCSLKGILYSF